MTQDTQTVEELARKFCNSFASKLVPSNEAMIATRLLHGLVPELLTTYGNARYEEGVKAERERVMEILEKTKDRVDCNKPTCDTCKQSLARNAGLDRAIYLLSDNK